MNSRNHPKHGSFGRYIGQSMKNWLGQQSPPADAREKLLRAASMDSLEKTTFQRLWQPFLRDLTLGIASALSLNTKEHSKYSNHAQYLLLKNTHTHCWGAYQMMVRSVPAGMGLLCILH